MPEQSAAIHAAHAEVDRVFDDYVALLRDLVRCPSPLGDVRGAQELVYRQLRQIGLEARIADVEPEAIVAHPDYAPVAWSAAGQPNVWGVLPATTTGGSRWC